MIGDEEAHLMLLAPTGDPSIHRIVLGGRFGEESVAMSWQRLDRFAESNGRIVDTAHSYANGNSERVIGEWMRSNPGVLTVVDKIGHPDDDGRLDLSPASLRAEATESARRLSVKTIDVLLLHRDSPEVPIEQMADTLVGLIDDAYARQVGVSNWPASRLAGLAAALAERGHIPVASYQRSLAVPNAPLWPGTIHADTSVRATLTHHGLLNLAWAAQARGYFTGTTELPSSGKGDPFDTAENHARRQRCRELADELDVRPETVALAWLMHQFGTWPIIGPRSITELDSSLAAASIPLDSATLHWLEEGIR